MNSNNNFIEFIDDLALAYSGKRVRNNIVYKVDFIRAAFDSIINYIYLDLLRDTLLENLIYSPSSDKFILFIKGLYYKDPKFRIYVNDKYNICSLYNGNLINEIYQDMFYKYSVAFFNMGVSYGTLIGAHKGFMFFSLSDKVKDIPTNLVRLTV